VFYWIPACAGMTKKSKKAIATQSPSHRMIYSKKEALTKDLFFINVI